MRGFGIVKYLADTLYQELSLQTEVASASFEISAASKFPVNYSVLHKRESSFIIQAGLNYKNMLIIKILRLRRAKWDSWRVMQG